MLQLVNIGWGFFLGKTLAIHVDYTLSNQKDTYYMSVEGLMNIGIQEET